MNCIDWKVDQGPDGSWLVKGDHLSHRLDDAPKREVYQFQSRDWAMMGKRYLEALSPMTGKIYVSTYAHNTVSYGCSSGGIYLADQTPTVGDVARAT